MDRRRLLVLGGGLGAVVLLALVFLVFLRPSAETVEMLPSPTATVRGGAGAGDEGVQVQPVPVGRPARVVGSSARDPFDPVVKPTDQAEAGTEQSQQAKSSSDADTNTKDTDSRKSSKQVGGQQSGDAKPARKKTDQTDDPEQSGTGGKAPVPIGAGSEDTEGAPAEQVELRVVDVQESMAVVRINGGRTRLYLSVPDPTGLTYVSYLGGDCGWFTVGVDAARLSLCEGQTRAL